MTDKELLESAAKAAGLKYEHMLSGYYTDPEFNEVVRWNPLTDDGDALRLAVTLEIDISFGANYVIADDVQVPTVNNADDKFLAVRYAIVRAAAEMDAQAVFGAA